jgi:hypothetical protein
VAAVGCTVAGCTAAAGTGEESAALGRAAVADATSWETDIGTTIGAAVMATVTATGTTDRRTEAPAGDGHPRAVSGCAAAAMARPTGTAIIEEEDGIATAVGTAMGHTVVVGATSTER